MQEKFKQSSAHILLSESEHGMHTSEQKISNIPVGRWKKFHGRFKRRALYVVSLVVVDLAVVEGRRAAVAD